MYRNILLVPSSGDLRQPAVQRAISIGANRARAEVFKAVYESLLDGYLGRHEVYEPLRRRLVEEGLEAAEGIARECTAYGLRSSANAVWAREYDRVIAQEVAAQRIDLVIVEPARGRAAALSQEDWRMLSSCPVPVLVVKSDGTAPYRHIVAAVDPLHEHAKPAELDAAILASAKGMQALSRAELRVLNCFTPLADLALRGIEHVPLEDAERALEDARRRVLRQLVADAGLPPESADISAGQASVVLQGLAEHGKADLVVMGGLSRGRIKDFLIGSTAERLLQHSPADVLIVKPPGFTAPAAAGA
jgi:universal stress protein E